MSSRSGEPPGAPGSRPENVTLPGWRSAWMKLSIISILRYACTPHRATFSRSSMLSPSVLGSAAVRESVASAGTHVLPCRTHLVTSHNGARPEQGRQRRPSEHPAAHQKEHQKGHQKERAPPQVASASSRPVASVPRGGPATLWRVACLVEVVGDGLAALKGLDEDVLCDEAADRLWE